MIIMSGLSNTPFVQNISFLFGGTASNLIFINFEFPSRFAVTTNLSRNVNVSKDFTGGIGQCLCHRTLINRKARQIYPQCSVPRATPWKLNRKNEQNIMKITIYGDFYRHVLARKNVPILLIFWCAILLWKICLPAFRRFTFNVPVAEQWPMLPVFSMNLRRPKSREKVWYQILEFRALMHQKITRIARAGASAFRRVFGLIKSHM